MKNKVEKFFQDYCFEIIWVMVIGIFGRLIPHLPNMTPIIGLSLFVGANLSRSAAVTLIILTLLISDLCLALFLGYPAVGYFTLFTYSGTAMVGIISSTLAYSKRSFPFYVLGATCGFWVWTNFGVWLTSGMYLWTVDGLLSCYCLALPFLRNALIGDMVWGCLIFGCFYAIFSEKMVKNMKICKIY